MNEWVAFVCKLRSMCIGSELIYLRTQPFIILIGEPRDQAGGGGGGGRRLAGPGESNICIYLCTFSCNVLAHNVYGLAGCRE